MFPEKLRKQIFIELEALDKELFDTSPLFGKIKIKEPDLIELRALAQIIQSLYNGIENVFVRIVKELGEENQESGNWHKRLIIKMTIPAEKRSRVISEDLSQKLEQYRVFRHFIRHNYGFRFDWESMKNLVLNINEVITQLKYELNIWIDNF